MLDFHNLKTDQAASSHHLLTSAATAATDGRLVIGFAGSREVVDWQLNKAAGIGLTTDSDLEYDKNFWTIAETSPIQRLSVLPSRLIESLQALGATSFVARAGNGVIYYRGGPPPPKTEMPIKLMRKIKEAYDPNHTLPDLPELI